MKQFLLLFFVIGFCNDASAVQLTLRPANSVKPQPVSAVASNSLAPPAGITETPPRPLVIGKDDEDFSYFLPSKIPLPVFRPIAAVNLSSCLIVWAD